MKSKILYLFSLIFCLYVHQLDAQKIAGTLHKSMSDTSAIHANWIGGSEGYWDEPANWSTDRVPDAGADVAIDSSHVIITSTADCRSIRLAATSNLTVMNGVTFIVTNGIPDSIKNNITLYSSPVIDTSKNILLLTRNASQDINVVNDSTISFSSLAHIKNLNRPSSGEQAISKISAFDLLLSDTSAKLPRGLMASVSSATKDSSGKWLVSFLNASLDSLYKKLDYKWEKKLDTLQLKGGFDKQIPVGDGANKLNIAGSYQLYLTSGVLVQIEDAKLKTAEAKIEGGLVLKAQNSLAQETFLKDTTITLKEIKLFESDHLYVGKIKLPFVFTALLRVNLKVKAAGTMQLSAIYNYKNVSYVKLGFDGSYLPTVEGKFLQATVDTTSMISKVTGSYSAGIEAQLKINFFKKNKTGLTAGLSASGVLEGNCTDKGLLVDGKLVVAGTVGGEIDLLDIATLQPSVNLFEYKKDLFSKQIDGTSICTNFPGTPGTGSSHGDIHAISFDSRLFDFQSFGEFIAVKDSGLTLQVRQGSIGTDKRVTFNKALAVTDGIDTVEFEVDSSRLYINKVLQSANGTIRLLGRGFVERSGSQVVIQLQGGDRVEISYHGQAYFDYTIHLISQHRGKLVGLLGNWNGKTDDDFQLRTGALLNPIDYNNINFTFAKSWRISDAESLFNYPLGKTTANYTDTTYPSSPVNLSTIQFNAARNTCIEAGVTTEPALSNCIYNVSVTGDTTYAQSAIETQQQFTTQDPIIWMPLDGNAKDSSSWGNDGVLNGNYNFTDTKDRQGRTGYALSLNGNGFVSIANSFTVRGLTKALTVTGWIYVKGYPNGRAPFLCKGDNSEPNPLQFELTTIDMGASGHRAPFGTTFTTNEWHFLAMTLENGIRTYYLDSLTLQPQSPEVEINNAQIYLGRDPWGSVELLYGALDDIRVYNRTLSEAEVMALRNE